MDKEGRTPLILACTKAELYDAAKSLLELGSNVDEYRSGITHSYYQESSNGETHQDFELYNRIVNFGDFVFCWY